MRVAGIDYSSHAVDIVTVPLDAGQPIWHRFPLTGMDAFDRARSVADSVPGRSSVLWDDCVAVGIEHPAGKFGTGPLLRIQGAILARIPARMLVEPFPPAKWRKAVGLPGNADKVGVAVESRVRLASSFSYFDPDRDARLCEVFYEWPQDAHDAHLIALATRAAITTEKAA
jgi:hypothetical protein